MTSYNTKGEASNPPSVVVYAPLTASISGPTALEWKAQGTWTANYSGGSGAVSFRWYARQAGTSTWVDQGVTTQSYTRLMPDYDLELRCDVARGGQTVSPTFAVVRSTGGGCGTNCEAVRARYETALVGAVPNPARGAAAVRFTLAEPSAVRLVVYDALGREVARLVDGTYEAGTHEARLSAGVPSGVYVVRMAAGAYVATRRLAVVR